MAAERTKPLVASLPLLPALLAFSGVTPYDRATWVLEVFPIFVVVPLLVATYNRFPLTTLLYVCIFLHALVMMIGGAFTYARAPLGFWIAELVGLHRNHRSEVFRAPP